jgi:hypothetical protein
MAALWDTLTHTANGILRFAHPQLSTLRPVGFPFDGFNTIVETSLILITNGDFYRVPQFCHDFVEVQREVTRVWPRLVNHDGMLFVHHTFP